MAIQNVVGNQWVSRTKVLLVLPSKVRYLGDLEMTNTSVIRFRRDVVMALNQLIESLDELTAALKSYTEREAGERE